MRARAARECDGGKPTRATATRGMARETRRNRTERRRTRARGHGTERGRTPRTAHTHTDRAPSRASVRKMCSFRTCSRPDTWRCVRKSRRSRRDRPRDAASDRRAARGALGTDRDGARACASRSFSCVFFVVRFCSPPESGNEAGGARGREAPPVRASRRFPCVSPPACGRSCLRAPGRGAASTAQGTAARVERLDDHLLSLLSLLVPTCFYFFSPRPPGDNPFTPFYPKTTEASASG